MHCLLTTLSLWSLLYQTDDTFVIRLEHFPLANKFLSELLLTTKRTKTTWDT